MGSKHTVPPRRGPKGDSLRNALCSSVMVGALMLSFVGQASAQATENTAETPANTEKGKADGAGDQVKKAAPAGDGAIALPSITVVGEKTVRSIMDTGSSVEIFDSQRIESLPAAKTATDLLRLTPNVVDVGNGNDLPTVRGVDGSGPATGATAFLAGSRPRLNMSIDGRSLTYNEQAFGARDLWDMETVEVYRGPQSLMQGRNAVAGAVVMKTKAPTWYWEGATKASVAQYDGRQLAAMVSGPVVQDQVAVRVSLDHQQRESPVDLMHYEPVGNPREVENLNARMKVLIEPKGLPDISSTLTAAFYDAKAPQIEQNPAAVDNTRFSHLRPVFENQSMSGIWDLSWKYADNLSFENKLIYTNFANNRVGVYGNTVPTAAIDGDEVVVEPMARFSGLDKRLRGLFGLRYFESGQDEKVSNLQPNPVSTYRFRDETETRSAFTELTYGLFPQIDVTVGGRFEQEHRSRVGRNDNGNRSVNFDKTFTAFLPKLDVAWKPDDSQTYGAKVGRGFNAGGAGVTFTSGNNYTYDEEYVTNYELYTRHRLAGNRVEVTSNLFYNDYTDYQLPYTVSAGNIEIRNLSKVATYGLELGGRWKATSNLDIYGSGGWLETKIEEAFAGYNVTGNHLPRAPKHTATLGAKWTFLEDFDLGGNATYTGKYMSGVDNDLRGKIDGYVVVNAELGFNFDHGRAALFAKNLFDSENELLVYSNDRSVPLVEHPSTFGASLELRF